MTIEQKAIEMLQGDDVLIEVLKSRNAYGLKKYGKSLDSNHATDEERAIHAIQELLDAGQYLIWLNMKEEYYNDIFVLASDLALMFNLTAKEIIEGGKR
jgi:hypothetical protein